MIYDYGQVSLYAAGLIIITDWQVMTVKFVDVRATEIALEWEAPPGRQKNIVGYNITYRRATYSEVLTPTKPTQHRDPKHRTQTPRPCDPQARRSP